MKRIAIITGVEEEAAAFRPGDGELRQLQDLSLRLLDHHGLEVAITCSGIGKVNAASAATALALSWQTDMLMVIGTTGRIAAIEGDCFVINEAVQGDYGAQRANGFAHFTAGSWPIGEAILAPFVAMELPDIGLPKARIATGDSFVECLDHGARLADALGAAIVDMETGAVAQVAKRLCLPWAAIKAVSDDANHDSATDFMTHFRAAARRAAIATEEALALLSREA